MRSGTINDVARAIAMAREANALSFVDAVHYAPHQLVDVREWGCDFLACSAYKFHGPHVGVLYGKRERLEALDLPKLEPAPETVPEKLETGTQNHEGIVGRCGRGGLSRLARQGGPAAGSSSRRERLQAVFDAFHERGSALLKRLWEGLERNQGRQAVMAHRPPRRGRRHLPSPCGPGRPKRSAGSSPTEGFLPRTVTFTR